MKKTLTQLAIELEARNYPPEGYSVKLFLEDLLKRGILKKYEMTDETGKKYLIEFN